MSNQEEQANFQLLQPARRQGTHYIDPIGNLLPFSIARRSGNYTPLGDNDLEKLTKLYQESSVIFKGLQNSYKDQEVHIFGTGPSLNEYAVNIDWSRKLTVGVNGAPFVNGIDNLKYWLMCDDFLKPTCCPVGLAEKVREWLSSQNNTTCFIRKGILTRFDGYKNLKNLNVFDHSPIAPAALRFQKGLFWGRSTVHAALDLVRLMGCNPVYLWGIDYHNVHQHAYGSWDNHQLDDRKENENFNKVTQQFVQIRDSFPEDTLIYNCNPNSKLEVFEKIDPDSIKGLVAKFVPEKQNYLHVIHEVKEEFGFNAINKEVSYFKDNALSVFPLDFFSAKEIKIFNAILDRCAKLRISSTVKPE